MLIRMNGMRKYSQYYGHKEQHTNARPTKLLFDQSMGKKQSSPYIFDSRHLLLHNYYISMSNRQERTDYSNSVSQKNIDSWLSNTRKFKNNNRKHGTTVTSKTKTYRSVTLLYFITIKSKENPRNYIQNGWDLTFSKKYTPMARSN